MVESLLSFSNINLFGQVIVELAISDPTKHKGVDAATTGHVSSLAGLTVDGEDLEPGDRVLVWKQDDAHLAENGVYQVGSGTGNPWTVTFPNMKVGTLVRSKGGIENKNRKWKFDVVQAKGRASATFNPASTAANPRIDQISVEQIVLCEKRVFEQTWPQNVITAHIADAINDNKGSTKYSAKSSTNSVTVEAPLEDGAAANGKTLVIISANMTITPATILFSGGSETTLRKYIPLEKRQIKKLRKGSNRQLEYQLTSDACFARIYGFSYEGSYYDLSRPVVFLVHGEGELVNIEEPNPAADPSPSRAPGATSLTGLIAAGFDFADGLRVWSYDQADYTIRMDVETGMFEDVLLAAMLDGGGPGGIDSSGMNARGMNARGMNARGMNARGMNARGMNARGMNARGGGSD